MERQTDRFMEREKTATAKIRRSPGEKLVIIAVFSPLLTALDSRGRYLSARGNRMHSRHSRKIN